MCDGAMSTICRRRRFTTSTPRARHVASPHPTHHTPHTAPPRPVVVDARTAGMEALFAEMRKAQAGGVDFAAWADTFPLFCST